MKALSKTSLNGIEPSRRHPRSRRRRRVRRAIQARQAVFLTLRRVYEEARIAQARDVPSVTAVDPAAPLARQSWPKRWLVASAGPASGLVVGLGVVLLPGALRGGYAAPRLRQQDLAEGRFEPRPHAGRV